MFLTSLKIPEGKISSGKIAWKKWAQFYFEAMVLNSHPPNTKYLMADGVKEDVLGPR